MSRLRILVLGPDCSPEVVSIPHVTYSDAAALAELHDVPWLPGRRWKSRCGAQSGALGATQRYQVNSKKVRSELEDEKKMRKQLKHRVYRLLNRSGFRPILTVAAATMATIRVRRLCKVSYEGEWVHRFPSCTLVEPRCTLWTPKQIEALIADIFLYQYVPREGDTIVDVGAGAGWETLFFSRSVDRSGRVVSIEAHPRVFRCLSRMRAENGLENVTLVQAAVADQDRDVHLSDSPEHEGNSIIGAASGVRVPCTTLDHIFRSCELSHVDFLKMNIEGAEKLALSGMQEMVRKTKNVCVSCHDFLADEGGPSELRTKADVIAFLKQNGFVVSSRESDGRRFVQDYVYGRNEKLAV